MLLGFRIIIFTHIRLCSHVITGFGLAEHWIMFILPQKRIRLHTKLHERGIWDVILLLEKSALADVYFN